MTFFVFFVYSVTAIVNNFWLGPRIIFHKTVPMRDVFTSRTREYQNIVSV